MTERSSFLVTADWLEEHLKDPGLSVVDGSWYLPAQGRDARAEYEAAHIPRAIFFDHDAVVDPQSSLPHTMPDERTFARHAGSMGIAVSDRIVVYDGPGLFSAPRAWWLFRVMGAKNVFILDGGFDRWKREGRPVTDQPTKIAPDLFDAALDESRLASIDDVRRIVETGESQIADARPAGRFAGVDPEPRPGVRGGHMPGARNLPASLLSQDGSLLAEEALRACFEQAGIDLDKPVVTSCGSGITAATISLALETLGHTRHRLYDGSWTEWGGRQDTPVETGKE